MVKFKLEALVGSHGSPDEKKNLLLMEDVSVLDREVEIEEPAEEAEGVLSQGFQQAIADIHNSDATNSEKLEEISKVLAAEESLKSGPVVEEPEVVVPDGPTLESVQEELRQLKLETDVKTLLESEGLEPSEVFVKALSPLQKTERVTLIESFKEIRKPTKSGRKEDFGETVGSYQEERAKRLARK